jgi:hypothetical protein
VEGGALLDELEGVLRRHVVLPAGAGEALALWVLHTYAFERRAVTAYIGLESPEKRCGKTTLLGVLSEVVNRPVAAANISPPALFRVIEEARPTLLIDEADTLLRGNDELRGILNAGYSRKTAFVVRVGSRGRPEEGGRELARFSCWCPKALAAVGRLPETLADRCIVVRMERKGAGEQTARLRDLDGGELRRRCARFAADHGEEIARARPAIPAGLNDRAGDIWEPLLALADLAGGPWPEKARRAAEGLSARALESDSGGALLLEIWELFDRTGANRMFSRDLVRELNKLEERPWGEGTSRKPVTEHWLARRLRAYGIRSRTMRLLWDVGRGYARADFEEVFRRYVPPREAERRRAERPSAEDLAWQRENERNTQAEVNRVMGELRAKLERCKIPDPYDDAGSG